LTQKNQKVKAAQQFPKKHSQRRKETNSALPVALLQLGTLIGPFDLWGLIT
jgi:hypothetical protein